MSSAPEGHVDQIKADPHWRLVIRPEPFVASRLTIEGCLATLQKSRVLFRGWDFPHLNPNDSPEIGQDYVGYWSAFMGHLEYWRLFQSGQFVYLSSVRETTEPGWRAKLESNARHRIVPPTKGFDWTSVPGFLEVGNVVYTITEFYEFAARLAQTVQPDEVEINLSLHQVAGFVLAVDDPLRGWWEYYSSDLSDLSHVTRVPLLQLVSSSSELALDATKELFVRFHWLQPNMEALRADQQQLLGSRRTQ